MSPHALISGASIAGPALAHELGARGWRTTVLERFPQLREEGQNIDIRGAARAVVRRMGLEEAVLAAGTGEVGLRFVDERGGAIAEFPAGENDTDGGTAEAEILRGELARLLHERTLGDTDYRFGESISEVRRRPDGVTAVLASGDVVDADLLVVAEGARSRTRAMLFDDVRVTELGLHIAYLAVPRVGGDDRWWRWHSATGSRSVSLRPDNVGSTRAMLAFLTTVRGLADLEPAARNHVLRRTFADVGWQAPRVLDALDDAPTYFDAVAQVRLPRWSAGRTVLLGDAAWSPGPFGTGTSLALVGAHVLAGELTARDDHAAAFARYEQVMRPFVARAQGVRPSALRVMNPSSRVGGALQRTAFRSAAALSSGPLGGLVGKLTRPPSEAVDLPDYPATAASPSRHR